MQSLSHNKHRKFLLNPRLRRTHLSSLSEGESSPSTSLAASFLNASRPRTGRYSWLIFPAATSSAIWRSTLATTGRMKGFDSSVLI